MRLHVHAERARGDRGTREEPVARLAERVAELEEEWEIERVLALQSSATALSGLMLGLVAGRRWLLLTAVTTGFLLQHAVQGWCPPLELHRRLGYRTRREIDLELHVLKALRGDFSAFSGRAQAGATGAA